MESLTPIHRQTKLWTTIYPKPFLTPPVSGTPVHKLPSEILSAILKIAVALRKEDVVYSSLRGKRLAYPVVLSHVCHRWREVAIGIASFWSSVSFTEGPPFERSRAYVERCSRAPFDIVLDVSVCEDENFSDEEDEVKRSANDSDDSDDDTASHSDASTDDQRMLTPKGSLSSLSSVSSSSSSHIEPPRMEKVYANGHVASYHLPAILDIILPHASHWRSFSFKTTNSFITRAVLYELSLLGSAQYLNSLSIYDNSTHKSEPWITKDPLSPFGGIAENLTQLRLWKVHLDWDKCASFFNKLECLELAHHPRDVRPSFDAFTRFLTASASSLRVLSLCSSGPADYAQPPDHRIKLPSLEHLFLVRCLADDAEYLFSHFWLPNVKHLTLYLTQPRDHTKILESMMTIAPGERESAASNLES
jgi:hypothetical protein